MKSSPPTDSFGKFRYELRIPRDRIAVLVGSDGETKQKIEKETQAKLEIDSKEGDVFLEGEDVVLLVTAREIVQAIGRGFNPETALTLLKQDYVFELISLTDYSRHKNHQLRMKGRIIGKDGRTREIIEEYCEVSVSVYGKTIAIIGEAERASLAVRAIKMLLEGSPHAGVYKWLERQRRVFKQKEFEGDNISQSIKDKFKKYVE